MNYKKGDWVKVTSTGSVYGFYKRMAKKLGLKNWQDGVNPKVYSKKYKIIDIVKHLTYDYTVIVIESQNGHQYLMSPEGLEKTTEPLIKSILPDELFEV